MYECEADENEHLNDTELLMQDVITRKLYLCLKHR